MVLELLIIGGVIYYYVQKNKKEKRATAAALQANQQPPLFTTNKHGPQPLPPAYGSLPPPPQYFDGDHKYQGPMESQRNIYPDPPAAPTYTAADEKMPLTVETREVKN